MALMLPVMACSPAGVFSDSVARRPSRMTATTGPFGFLPVKSRNAGIKVAMDRLEMSMTAGPWPPPARGMRRLR